MRWLSLVIKGGQILLLAGGLCAFVYGLSALAVDLWFLIRGVRVEGQVVELGEVHESREQFPSSDTVHSDAGSRYEQVTVTYPVVQYRFPPERGEIFVHRSSIGFERRETDQYLVGNRVPIRVLPHAPYAARLPGGFTHYLWAMIGFVAGLLALTLVSSLFFLHEAMFGGDLSKGLSLFRSLSWSGTLTAGSVAVAVFLLLRHLIGAWAGPAELAALVSGDLWKLPRLLAGRGNPEPGQILNPAERSLIRLPGLGVAYATEALEFALLHGDRDLLARYLKAMADPAAGFRVKSVRALGLAAERGNTEAVQALLTAGIQPDTALLEGWEPLRLAAQAGQAATMELLLAGGARAGDPAQPFLISAFEGRNEAAARLLLDRAKVEFSWRESGTQRTLADVALLHGMTEIAKQLEKSGVPVTLPPYFKYVVTGDLAGLQRELPRSRWSTLRFEDASLLHLAVRYGQRDLAGQLLAAKIDPNEQVRGIGAAGYTPLIEAVRAEDKEMLLLLLHAPGIRVDLGDLGHSTPLAHAVQKNRWDLAELLADAGASVNVQVDSHGSTPLHAAAAQGDVRRVQWLLAQGADREAKNFRQQAPRDVARTAEVLDALTAGRPNH